LRLDTKCSLALHCLLMIAKFGEQGKVTSELLSSSTGSNAVIIRNILSALKKQGLVTVSRGVGGAHLLKSPEEISVWDVYSAFEPEGLNNMIGRHPRPYERCPVGKRINLILDEPYARIGAAVQQEMESIKLQQLVDKYDALRAESRQNRLENSANCDILSSV